MALYKKRSILSSFFAWFRKILKSIGLSSSQKESHRKGSKDSTDSLSQGSTQQRAFSVAQEILEKAHIIKRSWPVFTKKAREMAPERLVSLVQGLSILAQANLLTQSNFNLFIEYLADSPKLAFFIANTEYVRDIIKDIIKSIKLLKAGGVENESLQLFIARYLNNPSEAFKWASQQILNQVATRLEENFTSDLPSYVKVLLDCLIIIGSLPPCPSSQQEEHFNALIAMIRQIKTSTLATTQSFEEVDIYIESALKQLKRYLKQLANNNLLDHAICLALIQAQNQKDAQTLAFGLVHLKCAGLYNSKNEKILVQRPRYAAALAESFRLLGQADLLTKENWDSLVQKPEECILRARQCVKQAGQKSHSPKEGSLVMNGVSLFGYQVTAIGTEEGRKPLLPRQNAGGQLAR